MSGLFSLFHSNENFDPDEFLKTDTCLQPAYAWIWNAPILRDEVRRQLDAMLRAGIRTIYILPEPKEFRVYNERIHMEEDYLSAEFFGEVRYALEYALSLGMSCWLYDEGGWPSGSACGQVVKKRPDLCVKSLEARMLSVSAGETYRPGERAVAAFLKDSGRRIRPGCVMEADGDIEEYYAAYHGGINVDPLDEDLGREFVESTHEKYTRFLGDIMNRLPMMFTDEPSAGFYPWPRHFEEAFREAYGYDIADYAPILKQDGQDADAAGTQARIDYRELCGRLFRENYLLPIHEWCRRNRVLSTGHLNYDNFTDGCMANGYGSALSLLRELDVPGVDAIWRQIALPTDDHADFVDGCRFFPLFPASAAAQTGGKLAVSESFAVYGAGLTGEEIRFVLHHQLVRGINVFNFNSMSYGSMDAVPSIIRPMFNSEMPGYDHLRAVNDYTARASYLMQLGEPGARTALYLPNRDIWAGGTRRQSAVCAFEALGRSLEEKQIEFDIIDDEGIRSGKIIGNELHLGLAKYRCILAPECEFMPADVREIIGRLAEQPEASASGGCPSLRVRTRVMPDGGRLWMLLNESAEEISMNLTLPCEGPVYLLDADSARIEKASPALNGLTLHSGEARFYLYTPAPIGAAQAPAAGRKLIAALDRFTVRRIREAWLDAKGLHDRAVCEEPVSCIPGGWDALFGEEFSGEAVYTAHVTLSEPLRAGVRYELDLGRVECSAKIKADGTEIGTVWSSPKKIRLDGSMLCGKKEFVLEIEVANTLANQYLKNPPETLYPPEEIGPYQDRMKVIEEGAPRGGLYGPAALYELD